MIYETVVTTRTAEGKIHIAPMGVRRSDGNIILAPFRPSGTLDNLLRDGVAVINYTDDVRVIAGCLTGRFDWPLAPATCVPGMRLANCLAHAEVRVERTVPDETRPQLYCRVVYEATHAPFRGFNRAQAAVVEAAILVSRLHLLPREKIEREMAYLAIAVEKTAGSREREAWSWLRERVERHYAGQAVGSRV
ncbi:MAG: DUF447 domain-containing protein [Sulfurifustis sp.]